jgi:hypothetical protein
MAGRKQIRRLCFPELGVRLNLPSLWIRVMVSGRWVQPEGGQEGWGSSVLVWMLEAEISNDMKIYGPWQINLINTWKPTERGKGENAATN